MRKLFKFLKPYGGAVLAIFCVLIVQAYCDLSLPTYTSDIVNVGIQQKGIEEKIPYEISGKDLEHLLLFVPAKDAAALYKAMLTLPVDNRDLKQEMEEALAENKKAVLRYSKEKIARQYIKLFYEAADKNQKIRNSADAGKHQIQQKIRNSADAGKRQIQQKQSEENFEAEKRKNTEIFGRLFDVVSEEASKNGVPFGCDRESFEASIGSAPKEIDLLPLLKLKGKRFADGLWLAFFQKLPDKQKAKSLEKKNKKEILNAAAKEGAFAIREIKPLNSPYGHIKPGIKGRILQGASRVKSSIFLRELAKKMPAGIQNRIRGLFC